MTSPTLRTAVPRQWLARCAYLMAGMLAIEGPSAYALTASTAASNGSFAHVGAVDIASGVLIAPNWVLTAAHVGGVGGNFVSGVGSAPIAARFAIAGHSLVNNDISLLYLGSPIASTLFPTLNATAITASQVAAGPVAVTMTSPRSPVVGRPSFAATTVAGVVDELQQSGITTTPNWLVTTGTVQVESGDSGSGTFLGNQSDSAGAVLLGVNSARLNLSSGEVLSTVVQAAPYRTWIDATMAAQTPGQTALWTSVTAVPEVPAAAMLAFGLALLSGRRFRMSGRAD